jgi:hypothetical protein
MARLNQVIFGAIIFTVLACISMEAAGAAVNIATGCDKGKFEKHPQNYPQSAKGKSPNRFCQWWIGLAKGEYYIQITSQGDFDHAIQLKGKDGRWKRVNVAAKAARFQHNGRTFYRTNFRANHLTGMWNNLWRIDVKPIGRFQNANHVIQVSIQHYNCQQSNTVKCRCPPGTYRSTSTTFGQTQCIDRNGNFVNEICN